MLVLYIKFQNIKVNLVFQNINLLKMKKKFINQFGNEILFSNKEYLDRVNKVKMKMRDKNIELLLISSPANQFYITGKHEQQKSVL